MGNQSLPEFGFVPNKYGWEGHFPNGPHRFFGQEIFLDVHTRPVPSEPKVLPNISTQQVALVRIIAQSLPEILKRAQSELTAYNQNDDPTFSSHLSHPHVWLTCEHTDELSWTFVVGRTDNPDFGYHLEFRGNEFLELWAGD